MAARLSADEIDERSKSLLKALIKHYIVQGQPVGSRTLAQTSGLELSAASIRNIMADLEDAGLIASPHASAGRVPTPQGYRLFVDTMLTASAGRIEMPDLSMEPPQKVLAQTAQVLSQLSHFVGIVAAPQRPLVFRHIEFLRLSERRLLLIMVAPDGDVQNKILQTEVDYSSSQLTEAANYLNAHFSGLSIEQVRLKLAADVERLRGKLSLLMQAAVQASSEVALQMQNEVVISGEGNLLRVSDFAEDMDQLRRTFDMFEQKTQLVRLLDLSVQAEEVRIFIGGENQDESMRDISVVTAPYEVDGQLVGSLGVIGPMRMPYERVVQIVDITSRLLGNALSQNKPT